MSKRIRHDLVVKTICNTSPQGLSDLCLCRHHKKRTIPLTSMQLDIDQSTANRRLRKLVDVGALSRKQRGYRETGGRYPDLYYLNSLGAAVLNRYLDLGDNRVKPPSVANPISNAHDLDVLELAIRLGDWENTHHRERMTFDLAQPIAGQDQRASRSTGEQLTIVPDLMLPVPEYNIDFYFEIEQTVRYRHIVNKYRSYQKLGLVYGARLNKMLHVWIVFGNERQECALLPDHERAIEEVKIYSFQVLYANMDKVRKVGVKSFGNLMMLEKYLW